MNTLRPGLPPLTGKVAALPIDERGYPVPWFVEWIDGKPDHRIMDRDKLRRAVRLGLCWVCGTPLGAYKAFLVGPMCAINRVNSEPPMHRECALYSVKACPFLSRPHMHRREAGIPDDIKPAHGVMVMRNPGAICLWTTKTFKPFNAIAGQPGILFDLGEPDSTEWFAEGRAATRAEVDASINSGLPILLKPAIEDGPEAVTQLEELVRRCVKVIDSAFGVPA
jgi:hypothetical protein